MKYLFLSICVFALLGCGEQRSSEKSEEPQKKNVSFNELPNEEQKEVITKNVKEYVNQNDSHIAFENYFFLLEQSNAIRQSPIEEFSNIKVLFDDPTIAELSLVHLASYEYLKPDDQYGELDTYGITFVIDDSTGNIESYSAHASFVRWDNGKIGARESLGGKYVEYGDEIPNIKEVYGN